MPTRRKPNHLRAVAGQPARSSPNLGGGLGTPDPPGWLPRAGKQEWRRIVKACAGHPTWLQEVDRALLTAYCATWSTWLEAAKDLAERGPLVPARSSADGGAMVKNPAAQIARDAATQLRYLSRELGFSPDARSKVDLGAREEKDSTTDDFFTPGG